MEILFEISRAVSMAAFLFYGGWCLLAPRMVAEFERYRLARLRVVVGLLELAGGLGLFAGYFAPPLVVAASGGLAGLMAMGVVTRWRIRDPFVQTLPALILCLANAFICTYAIAD